MNKKYDEFAYYMGYITADEFYKIYDKFAKYLPDSIDYYNFDVECLSLNEFFLELCIHKLTNNKKTFMFIIGTITFIKQKDVVLWRK